MKKRIGRTARRRVGVWCKSDLLGIALARGLVTFSALASAVHPRPLQWLSSGSGSLPDSGQRRVGTVRMRRARLKTAKQRQLRLFFWIIRTGQLDEMGHVQHEDDTSSKSPCLGASPSQQQS